MSNDKPNPNDLLDELESIRSFLSPPSEPDTSESASSERASADFEQSTHTASEEDIPVLTSVAEAPLLHEEDAPVNQSEDLEAEASLNRAYLEALKDNQAETEARVNTSQAPNTTTKTHENYSFDFEADAAKQNEPKQTEFDSATKRKLKPLNPTRANAEIPKGSGENPFLPPHIRQRLGKHKEMIDQFQEALEQKPSEQKNDEVRAAQNKTRATASNNIENAKASINAYLNSNQDDSDKIIDALVAEYLPRIEIRLREKLKERLTKSDAKDAT